jgi:hypothetical protein
MDQEQKDELIGLAVDGELPPGLARLLAGEAATDPSIVRDVATVRDTVRRLRKLPPERPDPWYVERALVGLLREHDTAQDTVAADERRAV